MQNSLIAIVAGFLLAVSCATSASQTGTSEPSQPKLKLIPSVEGADLFRAHCAACHGADARGNGPAAAGLKTKPADLTMIAARNGGKFPDRRIAQVISGEGKIISHGSREMPIWGPVFHEIERDQDWGEVRLHNLVEYLKTLQRK